MKAQILKIAGVKSEKEFYKKYPSEEAFMKVHGKAFKKAQMGTMISGSGGKTSNPGMLNLKTFNDQADMNITGMTDEMRQKQLAAQTPASTQAPAGGGIGNMIGSLGKLFGGEGDGEDDDASGEGGIGALMGSLGGARYGADIPRAQTGEWYQNNQPMFSSSQANPKFPKPPINNDFETPEVDGYPYQGPTDEEIAKQNNEIIGSPNTPVGNKGGGIMDSISKYAGPAGKLYEGYEALRGERRARKAAEQQRAVSDITLEASKTRPEEIKRKYVRPEDIQNTGEEFFPIYGVGTNPLARNGMRLQDGGGVEDRPGGMMGREPMIPEVDATMPIQEKPSNFDSKSARDNWVQKTGLPWSEAKRLGYTSGSAKDNIKLLGELNDPRFKKENLRSEAPKGSSQSRTPIQHRETPTGRLTPIKNPIQTYDDFFKGKSKYKGNNAMLSTDKRTQEERERENKRQQSKHDDYLLGEKALYYLANPSKAFGDLKSMLNPSGTTEDETSEGFRQQVMANRYDPRLTDAERSSRHRSMGYGLVPKAAANVASVISAAPYTSFEPMAVGIGEAAAPRVAGYLGQGARQIGQGALKQLGQAAPKALGQGFTPNFVMYENGGPIGGNPTEIQNTYGNSNSIYDDLGYEPLTDPNQVKSFYHGGRLHSMQNGGSSFDWSNALNIGNQGVTAATGGQNAGGQIGGTIGESIGDAIVPGIGGKAGRFIGNTAGQFLDTNAKSMKREQAATKRNITTMGLNSGFQSVNAGNASYVRNGGEFPNYEDGGYMNPEYNPQVITMFGDHNAEDFADYAHKDQYRAGGHLKSYTPPSERAMEIYEDGGDVKSYGLGGELQTHWGGGAETLSYNPYLPGTGETVMFRGKSHEERSPNGETGIGVTYGGNPVEVERGEPMVELEEGGVIDPMTGEVQKSGVVFGNLKIPNQYIDLLGDKSAKGKKFKNYVADLSKTEEKQNGIIEKSTNELNAFTPITPFDKLKMTALQANIQGANMKLKDIADKKINAASLQNAINDTAEERGLVADDLARGKVKQDKKAMKEYAKFGGKFTKAQDGAYKVKGIQPGAIDYNPIGGSELWKDENVYENVWKPKVYSAFSDPKRSEELIKRIEEYSGQDAPDVQAAIAKGKTPEDKKAIAIKLATDKKVGPFHEIMNQVIDYKLPSLKTTGLTTTAAPTPNALPSELPQENKPNWMNIINAAIPYLRPSDQEALDMEQLYPEMYAMSSNQLEPVPAQGYQPDLGVPYDISFQDQLNANQADYRAAQRIAGYNPAAQANLNAQKYQANQQVLGSQFRANQEMKDKVYGENRNILNQAKLTNLGIYDKQYERQAQALSNTKATTQAALNSIADKFAKNKLENRTLGVYENLYKYRYDDQGRAINMNPLAQFNTQLGGSGTGTKDTAPEGYEYETILKKKKKEKDSRNGSIVKSYKNL